MRNVLVAKPSLSHRRFVSLLGHSIFDAFHSVRKKLALILLAISSIGVVGYSFFAYLVLSPGSTVHPRMKAAAVTLRIYLGVFFRMGLNFDDFYPSLGWVSWVPNLVFVEWFLVRQLREELKTSVSPVKGDSRGST